MKALWVGLVLVGLLAVGIGKWAAKPMPIYLPSLEGEEFADLCRDVGKAPDAYHAPR